MPALGELLVAVVMVVGIAGVVVPVLPGLFLVWAAGIVWVWLDGGGAARIVVGVLLTGLLVVGTVAKYVLPARSATGAGAPRTTLLIGAVGGIAGFFLIPVVGVVSVASARSTWPSWSGSRTSAPPGARPGRCCAPSASGC